MAFHHNLKDHLINWLDEEFQKRREAVQNNSCKNIEEYRNRCGYLEALRAVVDEIREWEKQLNDDEAGLSREH